MSNIKALEQQLESTKNDIRKDWHILEHEAQEKIHQVETKVSDVKEKFMKAFDFKQKIQENPMTVVGGAAAAGLLVGLVGMRKTAMDGTEASAIPKGERVAKSFLAPFDDELKLVKNVLAGVVIEKAASFISEKVPAWQDTVHKVAESVTSKLNEGANHTPQDKSAVATHNKDNPNDFCAT